MKYRDLEYSYIRKDDIIYAPAPPPPISRARQAKQKFFSSFPALCTGSFARSTSIKFRRHYLQNMNH